MWLLCAAMVLAVLKVLAYLGVLEAAALATLSWWWVLGAFALTAVWFFYADRSGLTNRKAMQQVERRQQERLDKQRAALGHRRKR